MAVPNYFFNKGGSMQILQKFHNLALEKVNRVLSQQTQFLTAEPSIIILNQGINLPSEIINRGGKLIPWENKFYLHFPQRNFNPCIIKNNGVVLYYFSQLGEEEIILKVTPDKISLLEELPESLQVCFLKFALEDIMFASIKAQD